MTVVLPNVDHDDDQDSFASTAEDVWSRLGDRIEVRLGELELIVSHLFQRPLGAEEVDRGRELASSVARSFGVLGLSVGADLIRRVVDALDGGDLGIQDAISISSTLEDARIAVATMVAEVKLQRHLADPVAILGEESELVDTLVWIAYAQGLPVIRHQDGFDTILHSGPAVSGVLVVADHAEGDQSRSMVRGVRETYPTEPVVVVTPTAAPEDIAALASSVTLILPSTIHPLEMVSELRKAIVRASHQPTVALIGPVAASIGPALADRGFIVDSTDDVDDVIDAVAFGDCRAVVIGGPIGNLTDIDVLRVLHTDRRTRNTVIVVVSDRDSLARMHHAMRSGADLCVGVDVNMDDLAVSIHSLLARRSDREPVEEQAAKLGLVPWQSARVMVERMLMVSFRRNQPVGIGLIELPSLEKNGASVDEMLSNEFRTGDVISRVDDTHLAVVLQGVNDKVMVRRLQDIHRNYGLAAHSGRVGVVGFPADGRSLDDLLLSAQGLLDHARSVDGPDVVDSGWRLGTTSTADVLMVDPDETLGAVLAATLERRGVKVELQPDALHAIDHLTGISGKPYPRVVILELDLLGIDGIQFLRSLRDAGTMDRFKVLVLSARSRESDLRRAFELGVDDYVSKPFSTPLLMHRLGRMLDLS